MGDVADICSKPVDDIFSIPPALRTQFTQLFVVPCSINYDRLVYDELGGIVNVERLINVVSTCF